MPIYSIQAPDGNTYRIEGPEGASQEDVARAVLAKNPEAGIAKEVPKPEGGFLPAAKAGLASLKSDVAGVLGRTGLMDVGAAEKYRAEQEAYRQRTFKPTEEGWTDAPVTKIKELLGGSVPYMAAPIVAGGAAALAGAPALAGLGAGALASAGQFVGSGLSRQVEEGTPLAQTNLQAAALAAIPSAALDMVGFRMIPGIRRLFGAAGAELTPKAAAEIAKQGVRKIAADYTLATGKAMTAEGLTEAGQQVLERMQAGLNITDPAARQEYFDSFIGGAVLGGTLAPAGRFLERGREQAQAQQVQQDEATQAATVQQQQEAAAAQQKAQAEAKPEYAQALRQQYVEANVEMQRLNDAVKALSAQKDPLSIADAKDARAARDAYAKETMQPLVDDIRRVRQLHPGVDFRPPAPAAPTAAPTGAATSATPVPEAVVPEAVVPEAVVPEAVVPEAVVPEAVTPTTRAKKVEEEAVVSEPAPFTAPAAVTPEVVEEAVPTVTEVAPAKKPRVTKPKAVAEAPTETPVVEAPVVEAPAEEAPAAAAPRATMPSRDYITEEQRTLEQREEPTTPAGEPIPRTLISFEPRRQIMKEIDEAPQRRMALEAIINDDNRPVKERMAAKQALDDYLAKMRDKMAKKDATLGKDYALFDAKKAEIQAVQTELEGELLNQKELARLRGGKITRAELEAPKREQLNKKLKQLHAQLQDRSDKISRRKGVERIVLQTKAEKQAQAEDTLRRTRGAPVTDAFEEYYAKQPKQPAIGPVTRPDVYPPRQFRLGTEESSAQTTTTPEGLTEKRGKKQRNVQISEAEMQEANAAAPGAAMGPKPAETMREMRQERQLFDTAQKKVEELTAKQSSIKERIAAYSKLEKKKAEVQERLAAEKTSIEAELAGARADAKRLAPKTGTVSTQTEGELSGEFEGRARENSPVYAARDTVDLTGAALEAVQDGRVLDALDAVGANSNSPFVKELVKRLRPLVMRTKLRVEDNVMHDGKRAEGVYDFATNTVTIDSQALTEEALLHEMTHAVTTRLLTVNPSTLTAEQREARAELEKLFNAIQNDKAFEKEYGKLNLHEFASEVMSNKQLRDKLDARKWRGASLLNKIYRAFMNLIGLNPDSMAGASVDSIYKLFTPSTTAAKAGITMSPAGLAHPSAVRYANPGLAEAGATGDKFIAKQRGVVDRVRAASGGWLGLETQLVDRFAPLDRISKGMEALKGSQMMYYLRMYDQRMNYTAQSVANGAIQRVAKKRPDGRTEYVVESVDGANIKQVVDILKKAPAGSPDAANRLFTMYLAGLRAKNKGFDTLHFGKEMTEAQLDSAMASIRATPGLEENFKQAREVYNEYNRNMVGFLAQSGAISKEHAARLTKENDYIPFYREKDGVALLTIGGETPIRIGSIAEQPYLHELVGGDRPILDFLTSSVQNTALITDMGLRNLATKNTMNELQDMGLAQIRQGPGTADPKVVRFKVDGKDHYAVVDTDEKTGIPADLLVKGMQGIPTQLPAVVRALGMPATILRRAVTLSPTYAARQLFRDSLAAPLLSGANFTPVLGALTELGKSTTKPTLEKRGITGGQIFAGGSNSEAMTKILNDMMSGKGSVGTLIAKAESLNMEADAATRRAQYNSYIKQGMSEMEATLMSLESMNFNKRGASPSIHMANALIPFFNSQIQGLNVLYKALTGKLPFDKRLKIQQKLLTRGALMFGASLAYAAMMQDDEAYKNATPEQKYGNWFIRIPGVDEPVKLPIPFEVGYLFKALPEAIYNSMANESGSEEAFKALKTIVLQTIPGGSSYFIPQALKPAIEYGMGKSFYTGRDILSAREQQLLPEQQFRENSNEISKMMGAGLGLSPIKIEALVSGYTGTMGLALMQALSMGVPTGESPEKTAKRLSDMPVVGSSFQPNDAGGIINAVYERMNEVKKVKATVDRMLAEGRGAEAKELVNKHAEEFAQSGVADYFTSHMQQITKFENAIRASNMTGDEKRTKLDETRQMKIRLAETVRKATEEAKKVD